MPKPPILFSVIIPLHNKAPYIKKTLDSVFAQTFQSYEIILIDDNSTDGGLEIVEALNNPKIRILKSVSRGVSIARNMGISSAKGQWTAFLDADDIWRKEYLATLEFIIQTHPDANISATSYHAGKDIDAWAASDIFVELEECNIELIDDLPKRWLHGRTFFTSSVAIKTKILNAMQPCFMPYDSYGEDLDLWFRAAESNLVFLINVSCVGYRTQTHESLSSLFANTMPAYLARMKKRISIPRKFGKKSSCKKYIVYHYISYARTCLANGQRFKAFQLIFFCGIDNIYSLRWWATLPLLAMTTNQIKSINKIRAHSARRQ